MFPRHTQLLKTPTHRSVSKSTFQRLRQDGVLDNPFDDRVTTNRLLGRTLDIRCGIFDDFGELEDNPHDSLAELSHLSGRTSFNEFILALKFGNAIILSSRLRCICSICSRRLAQTAEQIFRRVDIK